MTKTYMKKRLSAAKALTKPKEFASPSKGEIYGNCQLKEKDDCFIITNGYVFVMLKQEIGDFPMYWGVRSEWELTSDSAPIRKFYEEEFTNPIELIAPTYESFAEKNNEIREVMLRWYRTDAYQMAENMPVFDARYLSWIYDLLRENKKTEIKCYLGASNNMMSPMLLVSEFGEAIILPIRVRNGRDVFSLRRLYEKQKAEGEKFYG
jgi:hypothetical protein